MVTVVDPRRTEHRVKEVVTVIAVLNMATGMSARFSLNAHSLMLNVHSGSTAAYCSPANNCQTSFGTCTGSSPTSQDGQCGGQAGQTCKGSSFGNCCSQYGYCGSKTAYCGTGWLSISIRQLRQRFFINVFLEKHNLDARKLIYSIFNARKLVYTFFNTYQLKPSGFFFSSCVSKFSLWQGLWEDKPVRDQNTAVAAASIPM